MSLITYSKDHSVRLYIEETALGFLNKLFGEITTSGLLIFRIVCNLSKWYICEGVLGTHT